METSAWSKTTINRLVDRLDAGSSIDELATLLDDELITDDPRITKLSPASRHRYCVLAVTAMLAEHWSRRLEIETASARADDALSWRLIASATGRGSERAAMMSARRLRFTPARRHRTRPRTLIPRPDTTDDGEEFDKQREI